MGWNARECEARLRSFSSRYAVGFESERCHRTASCSKGFEFQGVRGILEIGGARVIPVRGGGVSLAAGIA
jgi:hypothetical protein